MKYKSYLQEQCRANNLEFKECTSYHWQVKGVYLVSIWPHKRAYYIQGAEKKHTFKDITEVILVAKGELNAPEAIVKTPRRKFFNKRHKDKTKLKLFAKSKDCFVCGIEMVFEETTLEHKVPLMRGGSNRFDNLALSHKECNFKRGNEMTVNTCDQ